MPSLTAAAPAPLPLRHCAGQRNPRSPACGLQAATASHPAPRQRLRPWLCLSCGRRPAGAGLCSVRAFSRTARRLRHQLRSWLCRLRRGAVRPPALRGPPPLTCGEADGCVGGRGRPQDQNRATCCIAHPFGGCAAQQPAAPRPHSCSIPQVAHPQGKPAARDCPSEANPVSSLRSTAHRRAGVNSPLRVEL